MIDHKRPSPNFESPSSRRSFLAAAGGAATSTMARAQAAPIPIIDTHFHLYDPTRPQGAPYPRTPNRLRSCRATFVRRRRLSVSSAASRSKPAPGSKIIFGCS